MRSENGNTERSIRMSKAARRTAARDIAMGFWVVGRVVVVMILGYALLVGLMLL
tara:strand:- start:48 stop:209 length:162 start_codon:yes stop_codon:yes gene_type:complete